MTMLPAIGVNGAPVSAFDARLESLRGIACLTVCVFHASHVFASDPQRVFSNTLLLAANPAAAVMFFFVLSGHVLGASLERDLAIAPYLVRRLFRLLPAFAGAVLFAFACQRLVRIDPAPQGLSSGFTHLFWPQPAWHDLWDNLRLATNRVNGPTWTLFPELLGSLMLPFAIAAHGRIDPRWRWALFAAITVLLASSLFRTLLWFYFGCFLVKEFAVVLAGRRQFAVAAFVLGLAGLEMAGSYDEFYTLGIVLVSAAASALMIGAVVSSSDMMRWTTMAPLRFLGRISFSLYLVHWPIFYVCTLVAVTCDPILPTQSWGNLFVTVTSLAIAIPVAALAYRFIETPAIRAGAFLARLMARSWRHQPVAHGAG